MSKYGVDRDNDVVVTGHYAKDPKMNTWRLKNYISALSPDLMRERFNRIRQDEASKGGLVVVAALYGKLLDGEKLS